MTLAVVPDLSATWRARADELEPYAPAAAQAFRTAADEIEEALAAAEDELLSPTQAAEASGLAERTLRDHRARGLLEDHGTPGRPRYRRGDLPRRKRTSSDAGWNAEDHVADITAERAL